MNFVAGKLDLKTKKNFKRKKEVPESWRIVEGYHQPETLSLFGLEGSAENLEHKNVLFHPSSK